MQIIVSNIYFLDRVKTFKRRKVRQPKLRLLGPDNSFSNLRVSEEDCLWNTAFKDADTVPEKLLAAMIFVTSKHFGIRSGNDMVAFDPETSLAITFPSEGDVLMEFKQREPALYHMEKVDDTRGFYYRFKLYQARLPENISAFWQHPLPHVKPSDGIWFHEDKKLGKNFFNALLKDMFNIAGISTSYSLKSVGYRLSDCTPPTQCSIEELDEVVSVLSEQQSNDPTQQKASKPTRGIPDQSPDQSSEQLTEQALLEESSLDAPLLEDPYLEESLLEDLEELKEEEPHKEPTVQQLMGLLENKNDGLSASPKEILIELGMNEGMLTR